METAEARRRIISALLQAGGPLTLRALAQQAGIPEAEARTALIELIAEEQVLGGRLLPGEPLSYCWWAVWAREIERRTLEARQRLYEVVGLPANAEQQRPDLDGDAARKFCDYVIDEYTPPEDKRALVFLQCSVRRPFSSSPSHASMRRAIALATGYDPADDFVRCPVHVVVIASYVGPVPYELQDVYPANVRAGGVKQMGEAQYAHARSALADRLGRYIAAHRASYDHVAAFTEGRYGEVMAAAADVAGVTFPILPSPGGQRVLKMGKSAPRNYWQAYWIQLYLEVVSWLDEAQQARAAQRLRETEVTYRA